MVTALDDQRRSLGLLLAREPEVFGRYCLGGSYTPDQRRVMESVRDHKRTAVHSGHNVGKTRVAADIALWWLNTRRPSLVITTAPTWTQVKRVLWKEIRSRHHLARVKLSGKMPPVAPELVISEKHFGIGISTKDVDNLSGHHELYVLVIKDEAAGVHPNLWVATEGLISGERCKELAIGNPGPPSGPFYDKCTSGVWNSLRISCLDHPNVIEGREVFPGMVTRAWIQDVADEYGIESAFYQGRVAGMFPDQGDDTLIPLWAIEDAMDRSNEPGEPVVIGCDVARFGSNESSITVLEGTKQLPMINYTGRDTMKTAGHVASIARRYNQPIIVVDDVGVGGGVTDRLRELDFEVIGFNNGSKARDEKKFANLWTESWWCLREDLMAGRLDIQPDPVLKNQLAGHSYRYRSDGRIEAESKEQIIKRLAGDDDYAGAKKSISPDRAEGLLMANWARREAAYPSPLSIGVTKMSYDSDPDDLKDPADPDWRSEFDRIVGAPPDWRSKMY